MQCMFIKARNKLPFLHYIQGNMQGSVNVNQCSKFKVNPHNGQKNVIFTYIYFMHSWLQCPLNPKLLAMLIVSIQNYPTLGYVFIMCYNVSIPFSFPSFLIRYYCDFKSLWHNFQCFPHLCIINFIHCPMIQLEWDSLTTFIYVTMSV